MQKDRAPSSDGLTWQCARVVNAPSGLRIIGPLSSTSTMSDLPALLLASLNPQTRKEAEASLANISLQPGFLPHLLRLALEPSQDRSVRLSASVFFKNVVKNRWDDVSGCFLASLLTSHAACLSCRKTHRSQMPTRRLCGTTSYPP